MKKRRWSEGWMPVWLLLLSLPVAGQDSFHYRAEVDTPNASDFYRLLLSPEFVARSKPDLSDVRILGSDGRFVPYVLKHRAADSGAGDQFLPEPVIVQNDSSNRHSYITLTWHQPYLVGGLSLGIGSPTLYKRE
ncbi:MAG TPA: hypothetical protein VHE54_10810, partial [Puia sp.]|nr:hypothetical protein [Puia sp.]